MYTYMYKINKKLWKEKENSHRTKKHMQVLAKKWLAQSRRKLFSLKTPVFYFFYFREESLLKEIKEGVLPSTNLGKKTICKKLKEGQKGF